MDSIEFLWPIADNLRFCAMIWEVGIKMQMEENADSLTASKCILECGARREICWCFRHCGECSESRLLTTAPTFSPFVVLCRYHLLYLWMTSLINKLLFCAWPLPFRTYTTSRFVHRDTMVWSFGCGVSHPKLDELPHKSQKRKSLAAVNGSGYISMLSTS